MVVPVSYVRGLGALLVTESTDYTTSILQQEVQSQRQLFLSNNYYSFWLQSDHEGVY